jgi:hypothetical protein
MKTPSNTTLTLKRILDSAERRVPGMILETCGCKGFDAGMAVHISAKSPTEKARALNALLAAGAVRIGVGADFLHIDVSYQHGKRKIWVVGNPELDHWRAIQPLFERSGFKIQRFDLGDKAFMVDGTTIRSNIERHPPDPAFQKRQARQAALAARQAAIADFAKTKGLSMAEARRLLNGEVA